MTELASRYIPQTERESPRLSGGDILHTLRTRKKLSQKTLADLAGVSKSLIDKMERGLRYPSPETIDSICSGLRIPDEDPIRDRLLTTTQETIRHSQLTHNIVVKQAEFALDVTGIPAKYLLPYITNEMKKKEDIGILSANKRLGEQTGFTESFIEKIIAGKRGIGPELIDNTCRVYGIPDEQRDRLLLEYAHDRINQARAAKAKQLA